MSRVSGGVSTNNRDRQFSIKKIDESLSSDVPEDIIKAILASRKL
jgi:hypothetical protein